LQLDHPRGAGEPQPKTAFRRHSGRASDTGEHFLPELSREQSIILPPFACHPSCRGRDDAPGARDAARPGTPRHASVRAGAERSGKNRSLAGRTSAGTAGFRLRARASKPRRQFPRLTCPTAAIAPFRPERSMPGILRGVRSVRAGSIEAIHSRWRSTADHCPIPCQIPEPLGRTRTMRPRNKDWHRARMARPGVTAITFRRDLNRGVHGVDETISSNRLSFGQKIVRPMEQNAVVAVSSQLRTITAPALPRSNQVDATLFELI
jgi:hypothetical protein